MGQNDQLWTPADPSSTRASHAKDKHRGCFRVRGQRDSREHLRYHLPDNTFCTRRQAMFGGMYREGLGILRIRLDLLEILSSELALPVSTVPPSLTLRTITHTCSSARTRPGPPDLQRVPHSLHLWGLPKHLSPVPHSIPCDVGWGRNLLHQQPNRSPRERRADCGACRPSRGRQRCLPGHVEGDIGRQRLRLPHHPREGPWLLLPGRAGPAQTRERPAFVVALRLSLRHFPEQEGVKPCS